MKNMKKTLASMAFGCFIASSGIQAASIQTLTIEEIGVSSGGLGTSANLGEGGEARAYFTNGNLFSGNPFFFISAGSTDGAIIMGSEQANDAFTLGFTQSGIYQAELNTLRGAPSGSITNGVMSLDLSGLAGEFSGYSFSFSPNNNLATAISMVDANNYYYTADWSHTVVEGEVFDLTTGATYSGFTGWMFAGHLEGVASLTPVPEPETYAMMLVGLGLVGLMVKRRRKQLQPPKTLINLSPRTTYP